MKLLDFACTRCTHEFESIVHPDEVPECPQCKSNQTERRFSYGGHFNIRTDTFRKADQKGERVRTMIEREVGSEGTRVKW